MQLFSKVEQKVKKELGDTYVHFTVSEIKSSPESIENLKKALDKVGVYFDLTGDQLTLFVSTMSYACVTRRYAGTHKKYIHVKDASGDSRTLRYSDAILMMGSMNDEEVYTQLGMAPATYYRHKKAMKESDYFKALDPSRLDDASYLESLPGNMFF